MLEFKAEQDKVNQPSHYTFGSIECIEAIEASMTPEEFMGYLKGCTIKYLWRYRLKGGQQDLLKSQNYTNRLIQFIDNHPELALIGLGYSEV